MGAETQTEDVLLNKIQSSVDQRVRLLYALSWASHK